MAATAGVQVGQRTRRRQRRDVPGEIEVAGGAAQLVQMCIGDGGVLGLVAARHDAHRVRGRMGFDGIAAFVIAPPRGDQGAVSQPGQAAGDVERTAADVLGLNLPVADDDVDERFSQTQHRGSSGWLTRVRWVSCS